MGAILRHTTVVRDGMHNAFTDLIFWQGCYWVSYRKGASHISMDGEACLSVSVDRERFREVAHVKVPGDNRDPKLVATTDGRLAMYFPTWVGGVSARHLQQFVTFSEDGFHWEKPVPVYEPHWWLWRIVAHQGRYYSTAYTYLNRGNSEGERDSVDLLVSDDLLHWEVVSRITGVVGGESGMHFRPDGELWVVTRDLPWDAPAKLSTAHAPYTEWTTVPLGYTIHSPVILEHDDRLFVAGRRNALDGEPNFFQKTDPLTNEKQFVSSLGIWELDRNSATPVLHIPASGDCAYPGLIKDPDGRICLSYYSQHAYHLGVVPLQYTQDPSDRAKGHHLAMNDIYFAELHLP